MTPPPAEALYFGPEGASLFGWLHRPAPGSLAGFGLVICNPFGFESLSAHRGLRTLAEAGAAAGLPCLRFDYAGTGNSQGDEFEPPLLARWLASVHAAIDALKQASGMERVCLFGVRLGATLATLAALERDDVAGLALMAPVLRGRSYLRELTMLTETGAGRAAGVPVGADGTVESGGFLLTREAGEALQAVDLRKPPRAPAPRVLLIERDDVSPPLDWLPPLEAVGVAVTRVRWPGYAAMMEDPLRCAAPQAVIDGTLYCLRYWPAAAGRPRPVAELPVGSASQPGPDVQETAVSIPAGTSSLFGILTQPLAARRRAGAPAVLILNAGAIHSIGPDRLYVRLARLWAARGLTVLRLDLSGIGDSRARPGAAENIVYSAHAASDIEQAIAWLKREQEAGDCHVMGLCSGAYHALKAAVGGPALKSAVMINPLTYFWRDGMVLSDVKDYEVFALMSRYRGKVFTIDPWRKLLRGQLHLRVIAEVAVRRAWNAVAPYLLEVARRLHWPLKDDLVEELGRAAGRGVQLRFVFARHSPGFALLRQQGGRAVDRLIMRGLASVDLVDGADHIFTRLEPRERLVLLLDGLLPAARPPGESRPRH